MTIPSITNPGFETGSAPWSSITQSADYANSGTYSGKITTDGQAPGYGEGTQTLSWSDSYQGGLITFKMYVRPPSASYTAQLGLNDGVATTYGSERVGGSGFVLATVTKTLSLAATQLIIICRFNNSQEIEASCYFDDATILASLYGGQQIIIIS